MCGRMGALALMLALGAPPALAAQADNVSLGVLGGVSVGDVRTDDPELADTFRRTTWSTGLFMVLRATDRFDVVPNLLFQREGFRFEDADTDATFRLEYVTLPLLLRWNLAPSGRVRPRVFAGPSIGFEAVCKVSGRIDGVEDEFDCADAEVDLVTASTVYALVVGAGFDTRVGRWTLGVEGRYDYGLSDLDVAPQGPRLEARTYSILGSVSRGWGGR